MNLREIAVQIINNMNDEQLESFLNSYLDENTLARLETERLLTDDTAPSYNSAEEIIQSILDEELRKTEM